MHYRSPPATQCRSALRHAHPALAEINPQTIRTVAAAPVWLWLPSGQGEPLEADPMVWEVDESPALLSACATRALKLWLCCLLYLLNLLSLLGVLCLLYRLSLLLSHPLSLTLVWTRDL